MTTVGDLVFEMDSTHKKPYETLIIGKFHGGSFDSHVLHHEVSSKSSEHQSQLHCSAVHTLSESIIPENTHNLEPLDNTEPPHGCVTVAEPSPSTTAVKRQDSSSSDPDLDVPQAKRFQLIKFDTASNTEYETQGCNMPGNGVGELFSRIPFPYHNVVICVPSNIHSQKPYLGG